MEQIVKRRLNIIALHLSVPKNPCQPKLLYFAMSLGKAPTHVGPFEIAAAYWNLSCLQLSHTPQAASLHFSRLRGTGVRLGVRKLIIH